MYTIYSILTIVFLILIIVTAFITVALTYFQLAVEDHRWWWRSFLNGGSTGASCAVKMAYVYVTWQAYLLPECAVMLLMLCQRTTTVCKHTA